MVDPYLKHCITKIDVILKECHAGKFEIMQIANDIKTYNCKLDKLLYKSPNNYVQIEPL